MTAVQCRYKRRSLKDGCMCGLDSGGDDEVALPGFFTSAASRPVVNAGSLSGLSTALWDRGRYGSLRGSSKGSLQTSYRHSFPLRTQSECERR